MAPDPAPVAAVTVPVPPGSVPLRKGRQKGAISHRWRDILLDLRRQFPSGFNENDVCVVADSHGLKGLRPKDARDRLTSYIELGYVVAHPDGKSFGISDATVEKYRPATTLLGAA